MQAPITIVNERVVYGLLENWGGEGKTYIDIIDDKSDDERAIEIIIDDVNEGEEENPIIISDDEMN